ncbi:ABC transporter permease, partial [Jeotgalibacillus marinus]
MFNLIRNEWMKILHRPGTYVMAGLLALIVIGTAFLLSADFGQGSERTWQESLVTQNEYYQEMIETEGDDPYWEEQLAINDYRLANDLPPNSTTSIWAFLENSSYSLPTVIGLFVIILASGIVASEFSWGTIKLLMIRPIARWKILLSKFITVATFGLAMIGISVTLSVILGFILFDTGTLTRLSYENGSVIESSMFIYLIKVYLFKSINVILLATMAFMISAVFRNSSLAIGISLFLYFVGVTATQFIAMHSDWAKYILFANTDLSQYETGYLIVEGMTM